MALHISFIICILICLIAIFLSLKAKRKNYGFILTSALLIICDMLCILLVDVESIRHARIILYIYYIAYSWMFFSSLWTVLRMASATKYNARLLPMMGIGLAQTLVVIGVFRSTQIVAFSKRILAGRVWWIAEPASDYPGLWGFNTYCLVCCVACIYIIAICIECFVKAEAMFKSKFAIIIAVQFALLALIVTTFVFKWPVWIFTLIMNPFCYFVYYYAFVQPDLKLRGEVIMSFANEMSDGLLIYNRYNDLIHVNDLIKNIMDEESVKRLKDINNLESWIAHPEQVENIKVLPYKNGKKEVFFTVRKHEIGTEHDLVGTAYILHDTTNSINQIRLMEKVNAELERSSKMKSDFLANMSHELRTPMNAVIGMAEIALREDLPPRVRDCLNQINHSGRNLLNIINDILDYSKIDAGKMEIIPDNYEPLSEVNDIANILQTRIGDRDIELYFLLDTALPHELIGDSMRIRQVLINIANNAIKFTESGYVKITMSCEKTGPDDINLMFHVVDTGQGIREEDLNKLFASFQQVDSKRNRNVEGTGLGLAISKRLVEAMGGNIGVRSEYGKGSDFWFWVPQKVSDDSKDLIVEDAEVKFAYGMNDRISTNDEFTIEMARLGVQAKVIQNLEEYKTTGMDEFFFIEENYYNDVANKFFDEHPDITPVIFTRFGSSFKTDRKNAYIFSRPSTTLALILALNHKNIEDMDFVGKADNIVHFTAPDAKILVVDDNTINLSIAVGLLEPMKIKTSIAQSGMEALEKVKEEHFDLILMDHMMPVMDGIETTMAIRKEIPSAADTPIIALTANVVEGSKEQFLQAGMVDMIAKPIDVKQMNYKIFAWLPDEKIVHGGAEEEKTPKPEQEETRDIFDCLDCEKGVKGLGSAALFKKIVEDYYRKGPEMLASIEEARAKKDWADYAIKTHTLKSSSRQIGASELGDIAEKLEHAGKDVNLSVIETFHQTAINKYKELLGNLSKYFPEAEEASSDLPEITDEKLTEIFDELQAACDNLEMDDMEACKEKLSGYAFPDSLKDLIKRLFTAIDNIDTEACTEIIAEYKP